MAGTNNGDTGIPLGTKVPQGALWVFQQPVDVRTDLTLNLERSIKSAQLPAGEVHECAHLMREGHRRCFADMIRRNLIDARHAQ